MSRRCVSSAGWPAIAMRSCARRPRRGRSPVDDVEAHDLAAVRRSPRWRQRSVGPADAPARDGLRRRRAPSDARVLLRWHRRQQAWLQVGGHADPGEVDPFAVALREAAEETGLADLAPWPDRAPASLHLAVVPVPAARGTSPPTTTPTSATSWRRTDPTTSPPRRPDAPLRWLTLDEAKAITAEDNLGRPSIASSRAVRLAIRGATHLPGSPLAQRGRAVRPTSTSACRSAAIRSASCRGDADARLVGRRRPRRRRRRRRSTSAARPCTANAASGSSTSRGATSTRRQLRHVPAGEAHARSASTRRSSAHAERDGVAAGRRRRPHRRVRRASLPRGVPHPAHRLDHGGLTRRRVAARAGPVHGTVPEGEGGRGGRTEPAGAAGRAGAARTPRSGAGDSRQAARRCRRRGVHDGLL